MALKAPLVYETKHHLSYYECDATGHPSLSMLISMAVQVSEEHGNSLGLDTAAIQSYGGGWVITSYEGSFAARQPINGEELILARGRLPIIVSLPCANFGFNQLIVKLSMFA